MDKQMILLLVIMGITIAFLFVQENQYNKKQCVSCVTAIMACFSGFRSWWMGDLIKYYTLYRTCNGENGLERVFSEFDNIGIRLFFFITGRVGVSYEVCIFIIAAFSAITLGFIIFKYSPSPYWSYLMYIAMGFYLFTFSGLKQTIAMGFLMLALDSIFESKPQKFLMWTFIAALFHAPAFIFLPAYLVAKKKIDIHYFIILIIAVFCIFTFRNQIVELMSEAYYEDESKFSADGNIGGRAVMMVLIIILGAFLRPARQEDKIYCQVFNLMIIAAMVQYFSMYNNVFTRLADYYYQFIVLFMPMMLESGKHQLSQYPRPRRLVRSYDSYVYIVLAVCITLFALWFYNGTIDGSYAILKDYKFFWEINEYSLYGK